MCLDQTGEIQNFGNLGIVQQNIRMAEVQEDKDQGSVGGDGVMGGGGGAQPRGKRACVRTPRNLTFSSSPSIRIQFLLMGSS